MEQLNPQGIVVLAGLLSTQASDVQQAYENVNMRLVKQIPVGIWSTLVLEKR